MLECSSGDTAPPIARILVDIGAVLLESRREEEKKMPTDKLSLLHGSSASLLAGQMSSRSEVNLRQCAEFCNKKLGASSRSNSPCSVTSVLWLIKQLYAQCFAIVTGARHDGRVPRVAAH
jgi:hypothetical protein